MGRPKKNSIFLWLTVCLTIATAGVFPLTEDEQNTVDVVKANTNSVVYITNIKLVRDFFFSQERVARGTGSGFVWDKKGHIVTNYHVIEDGDIFIVTLPDQKQKKARLVGKEINKDIAVLKVEGDNGKLFPVRIGDSRNLLVGQKVIAIGNPFGFDYTVTTGIVSALGRKIVGIGNVTIRNMIQTDASINPGNSGGPLLNSEGALIGMNTMIYSKTGSSTGIGFAVPVETIKKIVPQIIKYGKVIRPGFGISFLSDVYARRLNIDGVVILEVPRDTNAFRAGLRGLARDRYGEIYIRDIIVGIDDTKITSFDELYNTMDNYRIGDLVTLTIKRGGDTRKVRFKLVKSD